MTDLLSAREFMQHLHDSGAVDCTNATRVVIDCDLAAGFVQVYTAGAGARSLLGVQLDGGLVVTIPPPEPAHADV